MRLRRLLVREPDLIPRGSSVLVAFSGGLDSTALLHLLSELAPDLDLHLEAAHFDHGIRTGSAADASYARSLAAGLGVPFHLGSPAVSPRPRQASLRAARYEWLDQRVRERSADRLAVGHHADDQAETVLFRIMRGTDLRGLRGIPVRRGRIVRPLLSFRREELEAYLRSVGTLWIEDPSNLDRRWARVRLRNEVMPALDRCSPGAVQRLLALGDAAARAYESSELAAAALLGKATLGPTGDGGLELSRARFLRGGPELMALALRRAARTSGVDLTAGGTRAGVEFISEGRSGGRVMIGGGLQVTREYGRILIARERAPVSRGAVQVHEGAGRGFLRIGERSLQVRWRPVSAEAARPERIAVAVSPGHYPLTFRGWEYGDRIRLARGTRKLKKLFGDRRIPLSERARLPVLADRTGNILWIEGLAVADACRPVEVGSSLLEFELSHE